MSTLWIIDGYNFIRGSRRFSELETRDPERGRETALRWLGSFAEQCGERLRVVLDAYSGYQREPIVGEKYGLEIWRSRGSTTADEEIGLLAREFKEACVVISSDREVQEAAVVAGAAILSVLEFERELGKILEAPEEDEAGPERRRRGNPFRPPQEKKRAYFLLRKYQKY